ncbi:hypothetical protein [Variovorax sp. E3]|uniref:hypothetical protein n=1 Tax=Variovorax sp. E3 TaxID=1914993 RepID=UPI0018DDAB01|nr:hypothetical protein [Variovorax sp. E3]
MSRMLNSRNTIASLLLLACALGAPAHAAGPVTTELPPPRLKLSEQPKIRAAVIAMVGYARGSYTEGDSLIAEQVLNGMRSRFDVTRSVWPDGRMVIASVSGGGHGEERSALMFDGEGRLLALGLVNGHCRASTVRDEPKVCNPDPQAVLTVFHPAGAKPADAEPLIAWSKTLPSYHALMAESDDPAEAAAAQKIANVEYIEGQPTAPGWRDAQLPAGFPASLKPLLVQTGEVNSTASAGKIVIPKGLAGLPMYTDRERAELKGARWPDAEVTLRSYAAFDDLLAIYRELAKGATFEAGDRGGEAVFSGPDGAGRYTVRLRDAKETGVFITVSSWKRK